MCVIRKKRRRPYDRRSPVPSLDLGEQPASPTNKKSGNKKSAEPPPREKFVPDKIERLTILADSTYVGYERSKYLNAAELSMDEDEVSDASDDGNSDQSDDEHPNLHQMLISLGFRPYPNDQKSHVSLVYPVHKRSSKTELPKIDKSKKRVKRKPSNEAASEQSSQGDKKDTLKKSAKKSRRDLMLENYRFCDIVVNQYKYRKRIGETKTAAEVVIVSPHIPESDRVIMLKNVPRYYMKTPPYCIKDETDIYVIRPPNNFKTKHIELDIVVKSFPKGIDVEKVKIEEAFDLLETAFEEDEEKKREKSLVKPPQADDVSLSVSEIPSGSSTPITKQTSKNSKNKKATNS